MLPEFMVKFKQYRTEVITSALDQKKGFVGDDAYNEHPSVKTIQHWHHWLMANYLRIDGTLRSVSYRDLGFSEKLLKSEDSLLSILRASNKNGLRSSTGLCTTPGADWKRDSNSSTSITDFCVLSRIIFSYDFPWR
jgi:hypothetical protein